MVEMALKTKPVSSSSSAVAPEIQRVVLPYRRPLFQVVKSSDLVSAIEGAYRVLSTLKSLLNVNRQRGLMPVFDLQARFLS